MTILPSNHSHAYQLFPLNAINTDLSLSFSACRYLQKWRHGEKIVHLLLRIALIEQGNNGDKRRENGYKLANDLSLKKF